MAQCILVIEDDGAIRQGLVDALQFAGYTTLEAADAQRGQELSLRASCDLILLDLMLPKGNGFDVLQHIRQARPTLPVIILTARGREEDRVHGLRLGADDYVVKPFSIRELLARVEAVLRRSPERPQQLEQIHIPGGTIDFNRCEIRFNDGARTELAQQEVNLLQYLVQNSCRAVSRQELFTRVWRLRANPRQTRAIDMHIVRLREKLRDNGEKPQILITVRGKGYMFGYPATNESVE